MPLFLEIDFFFMFFYQELPGCAMCWSKILADNPSLISLKLTLQNLTKKISWKFGM